MDYVYSLISEDKIVIDYNLDILKDKYKDYEIEKFDYNTRSIEDLIVVLDSYNFLVPNKLVILYNFKTKELKNSTKFIKYLENPNPNNILLILADKEDASLKKYSKVMDEKINIYSYIDENYNIDNSTKRFLIDYVGNENYKIINALKNIKDYKNDNSKITIDDIKKIAVKDLNINIFTLLDMIGKKNTDKALEILDDLKNNKDMELLHIIYQIAEQFRILLKYKLYKEQNLSNSEILKELGINKYRFDKIIENDYLYEQEELINLLNKLADIEIKLKTGKSYEAELEVIIKNL
jgi:DNA polymerase III, delta subunit